MVGGNLPAYQPLLVTPHLGALLQVTPSALPGDEGVMIDLQSCVTERDKAQEPVKLQGSGEKAGNLPAVQIDRLNLMVQQFATSLRLPLDQPILAGGMTFAKDAPAAGKAEQLYLVIEVSASP